MRKKQMRVRGGLALGLVAGGLAVALAVPGCKTEQAGGAKALALIPKDVTALFVINVARMRTSSLYQKAVAKKDQQKGKNNEALKVYDELRTKAGFDLLKDLDAITVGVPEHAAESQSFLAVANGKFDEAKLVAFMKEKGKAKAKFVEEAYKGVTLRGDSTQPKVRFAFLGQGPVKNTVVAGSTEWVKRAVDASAGGAPDSVEQNAAVMALVKKAKTEHALWGVAVVPEKLRHKLKVPGASQINVQNVVASLDFTNGLTVDGSLGTTAAADAQKLAQMANQGINQVKQLPMIGLTYGPYIDTVKVAASGNDTTLAIKLTPQQVDQLSAELERYLGLLQNMK